MKRILYLIPLLLAFFLVIGWYAGSDHSKVIGEVNGDKITQAEYDQHVKLSTLDFEQNNIISFNQDGSTTKKIGSKLDPVKDKDLINRIKESVWEDIVNKKLVAQQANKEGITVTDKQINANIEPVSFNKFLTDNKMDKDLYMESLRSQYLYDELQKRVVSKIKVKVTEGDIENYYNTNINQYRNPGGIQISHILVATEKEANDILAQLKAGADFATLAKKYSTDSSKDLGGYLGLGNQDTAWVAEFKDAALKLKPGEITSKPVKTQFGYHIIKAGDMKEPIVKATLDQARDKIRTTLQKQNEKQAWNDYVDKLKKNAKIKDLRPKEVKETKDQKPVQQSK